MDEEAKYLLLALIGCLTFMLTAPLMGLKCEIVLAVCLGQLVAFIFASIEPDM